MAAGEDLQDFVVRRQQLANAVALKRGLWGRRHAQRCLAWRDHLRRERNKDSWPAMLLKVDDEDYLEILRVLRHQGTGTRCRRGAPFARWSEAVAS